MAVTVYDFPIDPLNWVRVRVRAEPGRGVVDFTVQYDVVIDGRTYPVVRYDCAHGDPHRDILDADGHNVDKKWLPNWDRGEALDHAIADMRANWPTYRAEFIERMP